MRALLLPFAWIYTAVAALRNKAFDRRLFVPVRLPVPVISVGNIVTGGVGKTPLVEWLAEYCRKRGMQTAIVSRGYRRRTTGVVVVSDGRTLLVNGRDGGDEPVQMAARFGDVIVVVGEKRTDAARKALDLGAQVIIADDGFQHRYLARDLDIVVLDGAVDPRNERPLPAGRLRESLDGLRRADVLAVSSGAGEGTPLPWIEDLRGLFPGEVVRFRYRAGALKRATDMETVGNNALGSSAVIAFSGIGNHKGFLSTLRNAGAQIAADVRFPDHHRYSGSDLQSLKRVRKEHEADLCVTTEKDYFRMRGDDEEMTRFFSGENVHFLPVVLEFVEGEPALRSLLGKSMQRIHEDMNSIQHRS